MQHFLNNHAAACLATQGSEEGDNSVQLPKTGGTVSAARIPDLGGEGLQLTDNRKYPGALLPIETCKLLRDTCLITRLLPPPGSGCFASDLLTLFFRESARTGFTACETSLSGDSGKLLVI